METRDIIIRKAAEIFMRIGIKSVSMDDLARELGMSKKTIYQHFNDKRHLVNTVFDAHLERDRSSCEICFSQSENAIEQLIGISEHVRQSLEGFNPAVMYDIQKYYPNCWTKFQAFSREFIFKNFKENLKLGQKQGLYRKNLHVDLVGSIHICLVQHIVQPGFLVEGQMSVSNIQKETISYHLHSICTPKGMTYLKDKIKL